MGDFNTEPHDTYKEDFCLNYNLSNLIKEPTCFKNIENPSGIDLILTNSPKSFQHSMAIETGLSDFYKMTVTVMRSHYSQYGTLPEQETETKTGDFSRTGEKLSPNQATCLQFKRQELFVLLWGNRYQ